MPIPGADAGADGLRCLHLTDLHLRRGLPATLTALAGRLAAAPPDVLLLTGDCVEDKADCRAALPALRDFLRPLVDAAAGRGGVLTILGNHDGDLLGPFLADCGVRLLDGSAVTLRIPRPDGKVATVEVLGLPGVDRADYEPCSFAAFVGRTPGVLRVVLAHYPDQVREVGRLRPDIVFAGHTHGGQVCLPGGRAILTHDSLPRHQCRGVHRVRCGDESTWLVVSRGLGFSKYPVRLFCPPEVTDVTLRVVPGFAPAVAVTPLRS